jgi:hypothetical protein
MGVKDIKCSPNSLRCQDLCSSTVSQFFLEGLGFSCHAKKTPLPPPPPPAAEKGANMQFIKDLDIWYAWKNNNVALTLCILLSLLCGVFY